MAKVKHHRGKDLLRTQVWLFGIISRIDDRCYIEIVPDRTGFTLCCIIYDHVAPETVIYSDSWSAYSKIKDMNYGHKMVNHSLHFVDPSNNQLHSNRIESLWRQSKSKFKDMHGCDRLHIQGYLNEFMWRHNNKITRETAFTEILKAIALVYPIGSKYNLNFNLLIHEFF